MSSADLFSQHIKHYVKQTWLLVECMLLKGNNTNKEKPEKLMQTADTISDTDRDRRMDGQG